MAICFESKKPIINFHDILYVYKVYDGEVLSHQMSDHCIVYVYSGVLRIKYKDKTTLVHANECVFLSRNNKVEISASPEDGIEFKSAILTLQRKLLIEYSGRMDKSLFPAAHTQRMPLVYKLPDRLDINSLFKALTSYFIAWKNPTMQYMELKEQEAVNALVALNTRFCVSLFDFMGPWKIDILQFLEDNYTDDMTLGEMALYTGRSLSSFKRDFARVSEMSPQRWITNRRLEESHKLLLAGEKASDIYLRLGFKSLSHFSTAFRHKYGQSPQNVFACKDEST